MVLAALVGLLLELLQIKAALNLGETGLLFATLCLVGQLCVVVVVVVIVIIIMLVGHSPESKQTAALSPAASQNWWLSFPLLVVCYPKHQRLSGRPMI